MTIVLLLFAAIQIGLEISGLLACCLVTHSLGSTHAMEDRACEGQSNTAACSEEARIARCALLADCCCVCGCDCRYALRMQSASAYSHRSDKVRSGVPSPPTTQCAAHKGPLSHAAVCVCCACCPLLPDVCLQRYCEGCSAWKPRQRWHGKQCRDCYNQQHPPHSSSAAAATPASSAPSSPPPLFDRNEHSHHNLSHDQRVAITVLYKEGRDEFYIAQRIPCDVRSVRHWLVHPDLQDSPRSGRKRKTTAEQDAAIVAEAEATKFTTPRRIRRKLGMDVSSRTIDRRLIEVGLFGRVARHKKKFSEEEIRKRLSFAEGYKNWTVKQWMNVLFADEKMGRGLLGSSIRSSTEGRGTQSGVLRRSRSASREGERMGMLLRQGTRLLLYLQ
jgi:transposase